jgi:hypothetical protein
MCCTESKNMTSEIKLYVMRGSDSYVLLECVTEECTVIKVIGSVVSIDRHIRVHFVTFQMTFERIFFICSYVMAVMIK